MPNHRQENVETKLSAVDAESLALFWDDMMSELSERLAGGQQAGAMRLWLAPDKVHLNEIQEQAMILDCPTALFGQQIRKHFSAVLCEMAGVRLGRPINDVQCRVNRHALQEHRSRLQEVAVQAERAEAPVANAPQRRTRSNGFKILDDFVVGTCNRIAYDAVRRILDAPDHPVNPLFLHGASGLGKTHLQQGLAVAFRERYPHSKVIYMTCEQFKNAFLNACNKGNEGIESFRVSIRHADLLLIDDIHFLSRGQAEQTKNEMFSTLNELAGRGKKVVITSDAHPNDIKYLEERFVQRFTGGLVVMLDRPDAKVRSDVIVAKAHSQDLELPDEVVQFVADHITDNVRELEGAVNKLVLYSSSFNRKVDLSLARQALADIIGRDASEPRFKVILRLVADYFDLSVEDILGKGRSGQRSTARHIAMYIHKHASNETYAGVGDAFGVKSHSSVAYACEQVAKYRAQDSDIDAFIDDLLMRVRRG